MRFWPSTTVTSAPHTIPQPVEEAVVQAHAVAGVIEPAVDRGGEGDFQIGLLARIDEPGGDRLPQLAVGKAEPPIDARDPCGVGLDPDALVNGPHRLIRVERPVTRRGDLELDDGTGDRAAAVGDADDERFREASRPPTCHRRWAWPVGHRRRGSGVAVRRRSTETCGVYRPRERSRPSGTVIASGAWWYSIPTGAAKPFGSAPGGGHSMPTSARAGICQ